MNKKRGICKLVVFFLLMLALAFSVYGAEEGYCSNPVVQGVCQDNSISKSTCCPADFEGYGTEGYPDSQTNCENNYFGEEVSSIDNCQMGSCFINGSECLSSTYFAGCYAQGGEPSEEPTSERQECEDGCCCYTKNEENKSEISIESYCKDKTDYSFNNSIDNEEVCQENCDVEEAEEGDPSEDQGDGEETGETSECGDMPYCPSGNPADGLGGSCCCDGAVCGEGEFCCEGSCYPVPCDEVCERAKPCGEKNEEGCPLFKECLPNGTYAENCTPRKTCSEGFEVCDTPADDNNNGEVNCKEAFCNGMVCAENESERDVNCPENSYYDISDDVYRCCYELELNNCSDGSDKYDTCGQCDCLKNPRPPILDPVNVQRGQKGVDLKWHLNCEGVDYQLKRCSGGDCEDNTYNSRTPQPIEKRSFFDEGIEPNTKYCYKVNAIYDAGEEDRVIEQSEKQCFTSGDAVCMKVSERNFCLDETGGFTEELVVEATCLDNNTLKQRTNCQAEVGTDYVCQGPMPPYGQTQCVYQSPCKDCGDPFGMFADYGSSSTMLSGNAEGFCKSAETCFYDYTITSLDNFRACSDVQTCFDYRSKFACEGQESSSLGTNNKCLPRGCEWKPIEDKPNGGICMEKSSRFMECEMCNEAEYNDVLGACDAKTCSRFGECYLRSSDYKCVSKEKISCKDYQSKSACTGGSELEIHVEYDDNNEREGGTHRIETASGDELGLGVCRWNSTKNPSCYKDANFDSFQDPTGGKLTFDRTPPDTTILSSTHTRDLNITFEVTDYNPDGSKGAGVRRNNIYFCKTKHGEEPCYPDKSPRVLENNRGWINLGGGSGTYDVYYYAMDKANNLGVIKNKTFEIDMSAPEIDISYSVQPDTDDYEDSKISFKVNTSEHTHCQDDFEDDPDQQLTGDAWGDKWTTLYTGLRDGYYEYKVECTDKAGNKGEEIVTVRVNADSFIDKTYPSGKIDYSDVTLKADVIQDSDCRWGKEDLSHSSLGSFPHRENVEGYYQYFTDKQSLDESKTYSYHVKCKKDGQIHYDEIQFVYDNEPPETNVVDQRGNKFDFTTWYSNQQTKDKLFLSCNDTPENGFGCEQIFYCVDYDNKPCTPQKEIDEDESLEADFSESETFRICYKSKEKSIDGMGGKHEDRVCREMQIDTNPPYVNVENLKGYTKPNQPKKVNKKFYTVEGEVVDPDVEDNVAENTLDIIVEHKNSSTSYTNIGANPEFTKEIKLKKGLNTITLFATDRSGATNQPPAKRYVFYSPYKGDMISLSRPPFGVSDSPEFYFEVETFSEGDCRYSLNGNKQRAENMISSGEHLHKSREKIDLSWRNQTKKHTVSVFCDLRGGYEIKNDFQLSWDNTRPKIEDIYVDAATQKNPPTIVEHPLETNLVVETDDESICKYTNKSDISYHSTRQNKFPGYADFNFSKTNKVLMKNLKDQKTYTFYIQCENAVQSESKSLSQRKKFKFRVDTTKNTGIRLLSPDDPTRKASFPVRIKSTKQPSWCELGYGGETYNMTNEGEYEFTSPEINASNGENEFKVSCLTAGELAERELEVVVDTTPPSRPSINDGNNSIRLDTLSATWSAEDNETDIELYKYAIGSIQGSTDVIGWRNTTDDDANVAELNLTEGETYYWQVKAQNEVGRWGEANVSDGVYAGDRENIQQVDGCSNGKLDGDETDVDCGGPECEPCSFNATCELGSDCVSGVCEGGLCAEPSCDDNVSNQDETGVDCGGSCEPCTAGYGCNDDEDCKTGFCKYGECVEPTCSDGFKNQGEAGIDCGGPCNVSCDTDDGNKTSCEKVDGKDDCDGDGMPDEWELTYSEELNPNNPGDADENPDGDERTNLEEYKDGTNPLEAEPRKEEGSTWLLILIIILVLLGLLVAFVFSYNYFYYSIPENYRKYLDVVLQPVLNKMNELKQKISPYINKAKEKLFGGGVTQSGVEQPKTPVQEPKRKSAAFTGSGKQTNKQAPTSDSGQQSPEVSVDEGNYDAATTKELVNQIRKKRQQEKEKQREEVVSEFENDKKNKKVKRKGLLDKVEKEFGDNKKK